MAAGTGYSKIASSGLVFAYDSGDSFNSYIGEPTTNYWNGNQFSIYNEGATNIRNSTDVAPPVPGYEVVKVTANNIGTYGQCILWNATYPNNNVATITNSIYAYLVTGSYVQVGQHWFPWYYGTQKSIAKNQWVRISETYTINEGNSYGNAALTYSTNGIAYFAMPQYEYKSHVTPFIGVNQTRSATQALLDLSGGGNTLNLTNMSYDNNAMFYLDGTDDDIRTFASNSKTNVTMEGIVYVNLGTIGTFLSNGDDPGGYCIGIGQYFGSTDNQIVALFGYVRWILTGVYYQYTGYHHIVMTLDSSSTPSIYINGNLIGTYPGSAPNNISAGTGFCLGSQWGIRYANTKIPVSKFYDRALTAAEIRDNYSHYKTRFNLP
jgi:hypothetical protein